MKKEKNKLNIARKNLIFSLVNRQNEIAGLYLKCGTYIPLKLISEASEKDFEKLCSLFEKQADENNSFIAEKCCKENDSFYIDAFLYLNKKIIKEIRKLKGQEKIKLKWLYINKKKEKEKLQYLKKLKCNK
ncbi:MAG: hypothetical protein IJ262_05515 [Clostridia bacterium]|nr:hypothetical protein [Clostridia bacterium]